MSLSAWERLGLLERELKPYFLLSQRGAHTTIFSYSSYDCEFEFASQYQVKLVTLCPLTGRSNILWLKFIESFFVGFYHFLFNKYDILRSNQIFGSWLPVTYSILFSIPVIVRGGYELHSFWIRSYSSSIRHHLSFLLSNFVYSHASCIELTSIADIRYVRRFFRPTAPLLYRPNWVDTDVFCPQHLPKRYSFITIGRLTPQKNHYQILDSIASLNFDFSSSGPILFIGSGFLKKDLQAYADSLSIPLVIIDCVPNSDLAQYLSSSLFYLHFSLFEGHPKSLLEAMSTSIPCICLSSNRVHDLVRHNSTGFICRLSDFSSLVNIISDRSDLISSVGSNARSFVVSNFSLSTRIDTLHSDIKFFSTFC
ncbi:MAG: glycosyltransferase family 4 protein [Synechococcus sp. MIT S9220]|uniref:glycosyltransferase n=1 Tax=unclassified Synechococcus TaxID=2626047 RepID=UPI00164AE299|nr:glycosyltransferase [Synechococcus sp. MIT S9220]NOL48016.1 glycosyltransferase family 4 protein [Synechococcus sp. MIT S9220]